MAASRAAARRLTGSNLATSVGVRTLRARRGAAADGKGNTPAVRTWHQGFGVIWIGKVPVVPFILEATCRRVADRASEAGHTVVVSQMPNGLFVFAEVTE